MAVRMVHVTHVRLFFFSPLDHFRLLVLCSGKHHNYPVCDEARGRICPQISTFLPDCPQRLSSSVYTWNIHCVIHPLSCVCVSGAVSVCLCPAASSLCFAAVWRERGILAEGLCLITARGLSWSEIVQTGPSRSAPLRKTAHNVQGHILD